MNYIETLGQKAKSAKPLIAAASSALKDTALTAISNSLLNSRALIMEQNAIDLKAAKENGMTEAMQDRLLLDEKRIKGIANAVLSLTKLSDPVGIIDGGLVRPNGLKIVKTRVPLGVIGIIFESRPNVTVDAGALCLKAGNAVILRGGKEAINSNKCLVKIMREAIKTVGLPADCIQLVEDTARETATQMMKCNQYIDVLIPRGGAGLIKAVVENATVPVIETGTGNCHVFVDSSADLKMAVEIVDNGKTQRPSVCNAVESCLVHRDIAEEFLIMLKKRLDEHNVEIRGCDITRMVLGDCVVPATEEDYATEFLDYIISIKVVDDVAEAIEHISKYSTGHSECIVTSSLLSAEEFQKQIDAAAVYVNASTRFTDGEEFGLGAEIGISTQKLHARGPMGLRELTTIKYLINGNGQIR